MTSSVSSQFSRMGGFFVGPALFILMLISPVPEGMNPLTWKTLALTALMVTWWVTESVPLPITALLPIILFPVLEIMPLKSAAAPFAHPIIFLFMGGFILAMAIEKSKLHLRIALKIVDLIGSRPDRMVGGFMLATGFLSMWISNTATVLMMLPMALSVITLLTPVIEKTSPLAARNFTVCLLLGIAYASSIGGVGTLIGTPPNAFTKGYFNATYQVEISFLEWMKIGVPFSISMLLAMWFLLTRIIFPIRLGGETLSENIIKDECNKLGAVSREERLAGIIALITATCWMSESYIGDFIPGFNEVTVALLAALALFIIPLNFKKNDYLLTWKDVEKLPWGILLLFGGGLSLAGGFESTGLAEWIGLQFDGTGDAMPHWMLVALVVSAMSVASTFMSNVAATTLLIPIIAPIAVGMGENPMIFAIPATMAASCAFMLPVSAAANAIVFSSGRISIKDMVRAGFCMNLMGIALLTFLALTFLPMLMNVTLGEVPDWAKTESEVVK